MLSPNVLLAAIAVLHVTATNQPTASVIEADATGRAHEGGHHTKKKKGKAFYALFEPMLRNAEWPSAYGHFRDGVFILDPFNVTSATVKKIKADLNATVLMLVVSALVVVDVAATTVARVPYSHRHRVIDSATNGCYTDVVCCAGSKVLGHKRHADEVQSRTVHEPHNWAVRQRRRR